MVLVFLFRTFKGMDGLLQPFGEYIFCNNPDKSADDFYRQGMENYPLEKICRNLFISW